MGTLAVLVMLIVAIFPGYRAQSSPRSLDALLQDYAYRAFVRPRTGTIYQAKVPSNLTGIKVAAVRLKNGSLRKRGFTYNEFDIDVGVEVEPYVERLVLVYHNLNNWSSDYYPLHGYTYLAPVLGLLAYSASDLSARDLPVLQISTTDAPISINFSQASPPPLGSVPVCVFFNLTGFPHFNSPTSGKMCNTTQQGHFSIVVKNPKKSNRKKIAIIVGSIVGGLFLLLLLVFLIWWLRSLRKRKKLQKMEKAADVGETLHMVTVGDTRAPSAMVTRTQPILESEHPPSNP